MSVKRYRKKPVIIEAIQWFKDEDHPSVIPSMDDDAKCEKCNIVMKDHGWIDTLEGGHIVCPGDWIITGIKGEFYPCKPDIFEATYDLVE